MAIRCGAQSFGRALVIVIMLALIHELIETMVGAPQ